MRKRGWLPNLALVAGIAILLFTGASQIIGYIDMRRAEVEFAEQMEELSNPSGEATPDASPTEPEIAPTGPSVTPEPGVTATVPPTPTAKPAPSLKALGTLTIQKINQVEVPVFEGSGSRQLHVGIGHISSTSRPGADGNSVLAGHRRGAAAKPFQRIDRLVDGDIVLFDDGTTEFRFVVFDSFVVEATDTWVCYPIEGETCTLTLLSCYYPLIGPTQRIIVRARLEIA